MIASKSNLQCLKKQTRQGISKSKVTKSLRAHKNVRSDFWGLKWKQSIFSLINSIVLATMHANLASLRATAAMQKGGEIDEIALSIYYAPSSAHPVCFFKHCKHCWNNQIQQDFLKIWLQKYLQNKAFQKDFNEFGRKKKSKKAVDVLKYSY